MPNPESSGDSGTTSTARELQQKGAGGNAQNPVGTEMTITHRYGEALLWTEALHRKQRRKGKNCSLHLTSDQRQLIGVGRRWR